ncbi:MAG: hypothetical protein HY721_08680 [Planctomycetes bacterium]|nr:hypothetical protein [Planctomycetota bacterium]
MSVSRRLDVTLAASCVLGLLARDPALGQVSVGDPLNFKLSSPNAEILDISANDRLIHVVSPELACAGAGDPSFLPVVLHLSPARAPLREVFSVEMGLGETTSVSAHPSAGFALVAVKDADKPNVNPGKVVAVAGNRIAGSVAVSPGPDSVHVSRDGRFAVVACEAQTPEPEECDSETEDEDVGGSIVVLDLREAPSRIRVAAVVTAEVLFDGFLTAHPARAKSPKAIEPEFVAIDPESSFALVTLQEQSAVAVVSLETAEELLDDDDDGEDGDDDSLSPEDVGAAALVDVVLLPHGFADAKGKLRGTHPDGLDISPEGDLCITANEANSNVRHLQGISVLDLRGGPGAIVVAATYCIFDLDPSLLDGTGLISCPVQNPGDLFPPSASKLPRLDPEDTAIFEVDDADVAAVGIERAAKDEDRGSVLFLDVTGVLDGAVPAAIDRKLVGFNPGARPEGVVATSDGSFVFSANERDGGSITRIGVAGGP